MLGQIFLYAANRAVGGAVDSAARKASWGGVAIFLLAVGTIFGLIVLFWVLDYYYGSMIAGTMIFVGCFVVGLICLMMPKLLDRIEAKSKKTPVTADAVAAEVQEEVHQAVDYFGPIRVVGSALLLGVGIAKSLKR